MVVDIFWVVIGGCEYFLGSSGFVLGGGEWWWGFFWLQWVAVGRGGWWNGL